MIDCMCVQCWGGFMTLTPLVRLRTPDGGYVYMEWQNYCGPTFYRDRAGVRELPMDDAEELIPIWDALEWWISRGKRG